MFLTTPQRYVDNYAFVLKMALLVVAVLLQALLFRRVARNDSASAVLARSTAVVTLAFWLAIASAGRSSVFSEVHKQSPPGVSRMSMSTTLRRLAVAFLLAGGLATQAIAAEPAAAKPAAAPKSQSPVLTRPQLDALLAKPESVLLIDVRRPDEHQSIGAFPVFLSIQAGDLEKYLAFIPRDRVIVTVSNHAARAGKAADLLASHGFKVAGAVGAETYESEGGTLAKITAPPPKADSAPPKAN